SAGLNVELQFIPSDRTVDQLPEIMAWCRDMGCQRLHLQFPTAQGRNGTSRALVVGAEQEFRLKSAAIELSKSYGKQFHISRLWKVRWQIPPAPSEAQVIIRSDGVAVPCNACKYLVPKLSQKTIHEESLRNICGDE